MAEDVGISLATTGDFAAPVADHLNQWWPERAAAKRRGDQPEQ
ncbi:hypothetical protein [Streptomyces griseus]|nr:hypothetical protein [Streptomyces griseus]